MRKLAFLLAAALMASAPVIASMTTDGYAAAKKAKRVAKAPAASAAAPEQIGPKPPFADIVRAIDDLGRDFASYRHVYNPAGGGEKGGKAAKKAR
jgi:hypothetical protein